MYRLLNPIQNGLCVLVQEVEDHIKQTGLDAVKALKSGEKVDNVCNSDSRVVCAYHVQNVSGERESDNVYKVYVIKEQPLCWSS